MSLADVAKTQATNALIRYGERMDFIKLTGNTKNSTTGVITTTYAAAVPGHGARNATQYKNLGFKYGENNVRNGDLEITLAAEPGITPAPGDRLVLDPLGAAANWEMIAVQPTSLLGVDVVYSVLVRG